MDKSPDSTMNTPPDSTTRNRRPVSCPTAALALASSLMIASCGGEDEFIVDADGDGLIEIATARELHNVRHSLDGSRYRPEAGADGSAIGCHESGCVGYELVADIDFDRDGDGSTWSRRDDGSVELDAGDHDSVHFDTEAGGWAPIGGCGGTCLFSGDNRPFTATFEGNGHTIAGLAIAGGHPAAGMFGLIGEGAEIRNLGLIGNLARYDSGFSKVGGLVGWQDGGSITASYATGGAVAGEGFRSNVGGLVGDQSGGSITASYATGGAVAGAGLVDGVGGLVGDQDGGSITASYATGDVDGVNSVGGLVGRQDGGSITASYATGDVDGVNSVGGLVGRQGGGSITASYATGDVDGGAGSDEVGGLVGWQDGGSITASWATGSADGGAGNRDSVGGLVGYQSRRGSAITASYATGDVDGGAGNLDRVGGLVGWQFTGSITASYATGDVDGGAGSDAGDDIVGGLVGDQSGGSITASYATGDVDGGPGRFSYAGGLVGIQRGGSITTASWGFGTATGERAGSPGSDDRPAGVTQASQLASANVPSSWSQASSNTLGAWDFGTALQVPALSYADYDGAARHIFHCAGDDAPPPDGAVAIPGCAGAPALIPGQRAAQPVGQAAPILASPQVLAVAPGSVVDLSIANTGGDVTSCSAPTDGPATSRLPVGLSVGVADAEGAMTCAITGTVDSAAPPGTHTIAITAASESGPVMVDVTFTVFPRVPPVERAALSYTPPPPGGQGGTLTLYWGAAANSDGYRVFRGGSDDPLEATELTDGTMDPIAATHFVDTNAEDGAVYRYWVQFCLGAVCSGFGEPISTLVRIADADGDGLIEIATARELHNVRHSLDGSRYRPEAGSVGSSIGCPEVGCAGYELVADIDFDSDGDGSTWSRGDDGSVELDAGDRDSVHFDTEDGGWVPIGDCGADASCFERSDNRPFTATFEGGGHTIAGLATAGDHVAVGLFGLIGEGAEIRNLGLIGNLAKYHGSSPADVGGLVGRQDGGSITASHATGSADGGAGNLDNVGGLVGQQDGGSITASHATGPADGGAGFDHVGGLVGFQDSGSITASWATGGADGGGGDGDRVGGLVGYQDGGSITASHATGDANGGAGFGDKVGGLVGRSLFGSITASHSTGSADGGAGDDIVGGLVGEQSGGSIAASHATGSANGGAGDRDSVGGLVGYLDGGSITASWATGGADGGGGDSDRVGGLVGLQWRGSIAASHATGSANGGAGGEDSVGGLVGLQDGGGSITASYATGPADGGAGDSDSAGALVGRQDSGSITASWGFGTPTGGTAGIAGSDDRPAGVTQASQLASANAPASWSQASSNTLGAWDFGMASQTPVLSYADYDGAAMGTAPDYTSGHIFHCDGAAAPTPAGAIVIPGCAAAPILIPGQRGP